MNKLLTIIGAVVGGWIGDKVGGFMTAWVVSGIGSMVGVYVVWRIVRDYFD